MDTLTIKENKECEFKGISRDERDEEIKKLKEEYIKKFNEDIKRLLEEAEKNG